MATLNVSSIENLSTPCKSNMVCDKESLKVSDCNDSVSTVQVLPTGNPAQNSESTVDSAQNSESTGNPAQNSESTGNPAQNFESTSNPAQNSESTGDPAQNSESTIDSAKENNDTGSKVVVEVIPTVQCGMISALQDWITDSSVPRKRQKVVEQSENETNLTAIRKQINEKNSLAIQNELKSNDGIQKQGVCTEENISSSKYPLKRKIRRNHDFKLHLRPGRGLRLSSIAYIVSEVDNASPVHLRNLHYVLFGTYGMCSNDDVLSRTKQNILHFSGFPFSEDSEIYQKKRKCLSNIPYPMLSGMSNILLGKDSGTRDDSVEDLLRFLSKPTSDLKVKQMVRTNQETFVAAGSQLNEQAMKGMSPIVLVERLKDSVVRELTLKMNPETSKQFETAEEYTKPDYILLGHGCKLKSLPEVAAKVHRARRRIINLLHSLLYGKPGSDDMNRLNILEFSGFPYKQEFFLRRSNAFLSKLKNEELSQMCDIFSLHIKSGNKTKKIKKLLQYLQVPMPLVTNIRKTKELQPEKEIVSKRKEPQSERKSEVLEQPVIRLKDFENIPCVTRSQRKTLKSSTPQRRCDPHILMMKKNEATCNQRSINGNLSSSFSENLNPPFSSEKLQEEVFSEEAQNTSVIVHRFSESSYSFTDLKNNDPLTVSDCNSDESLLLWEFENHPTEEKLKSTIRKVIYANSLSITMRDLINKVLHCYPNFNMTYRIDFIKSEALKLE